MDIELESQLKLELNSSDPTEIHMRLSSYLHSIEQENAHNRVEFLNDCLDIFRRILFQGKHQHDDLFSAYRVCLRHYVEVASSKEVTTHVSLILKTIAKELHLNKERLGESSSLLSIIDFYLEDQSTQSISDAFDYYLSNTISALFVVYGFVSMLALNWTQELETIEEESKVVCIDIFHVLSQLVLVKLSIKRERTGSENSWMVGSAVTAFIISTKSTLKLKESKEVIMNIIYSEWCETQEIKNILFMMDHYAQRANEKKEGIDILNMSLEAFWLFLKVHPIYLLEESELEESELEEISSKAYEQGSSMLKLLYEINHSEMQKKLVAILEVWSNTKDCMQDLPTPVPIVKAWVECQLIHDDCLKSPILFNLLTPSIQKSKRNTWILLEQEWKAYTECTQSSTSGKMRRKMASTFMQFINTTPESLCQNAQTNIEKEKTIVDSEEPVATIHCLQEAITIMRDIISMSEHSSSENLINHQLFVACCLHDLSETKTTFESGKSLSERILYLIYNLFDLLQLKGFTEDSNVAHKLLIKVYGLMNLPSDKQLSLLWKNGRLGHPICISPLSLKSVQNLSNEATKFETYKDHFGEEFLQHFSFLFANSHPSSNPRISCDVTSKDLIWSHSTFHALIPKGKLIEALSCAKEAQRRLYSELKKYTHNGQINNAWDMIISFARDVFSLDSPTSDLDKVHTSPWKVLEGYLESTLQIGCIYEMMGDGVEAVAHLKLGKDIASSLDLPLFVVAFSSLLGKLYCQQQKIDLAESELKIARKVLLKIDDKFGCSKCKLLLDAFVIKHIGDLTKIRPAVCEWIVLPATAKNFYEMALEKLDNSIWKNSLSYPEEDASMNFVECSCSRADEDEQKRIKKARLEKKEGVSDQIGCSSYATCLTKCNLSNLGCWQCLPSKVAESGLLDELINLKWEFIRRKMSMQLLSQSGKFFAKSNKTNEVHGNLLRRISILVVKNPFCFTFSSILLEHFRNLVAKETQDDIFSFERAELLHDISLYLMKSNDSDKSIFSNQNSIKPEEIVSWLLLAFILSRDVPIVFQEVSKLLAVICLVSFMSEEFPLPLSTSLSKMGWVFYFHQASIGAHLSCQFLSNLYEKYKDPDIRGSKFDLLRPPYTKENLKDHVAKFILALPSTTLVCISLLGEDYIILLEKLLPITTIPKAWMLVSRKSITAEPVVMLLPLDTIHIDDPIREYEKTLKIPSNKWSGSIVDQVVPDFKRIIDEYYFMLKDTLTIQKSKLLFKRVVPFEKQLKAMLGKIEELWINSWKYLFIGELANCNNFDKVSKDLLKEVRRKQQLDINEDQLKIILGGSKYFFEDKTSISPLISNKGGFMGNLGFCKELPKLIFPMGVGNMSQEEMDAFGEALNQLEINDSTKRNPIILVLDYEIQMLPWESLPLLKNQEVYRIPSITSIYAVLDKCNNNEEVGTNSLLYPSIDPHNAFYVLNPDNNLKLFQTAYEEYFKSLKFEGVAGLHPSVNDVVEALKSYDIYLYMGHNSGNKFIHDDEVKKLNKCSAACLIGCSSGTLTLQGIYAPIGTPLSYLMAGSPIIVCNLGSMLLRELIRFASKFFENMLKENHNFQDRQRIGAFVADACKNYDRPYISGSATVCYGLPVAIRKKEQTTGKKSLKGKEKAYQ